MSRELRRDRASRRALAVAICGTLFASTGAFFWAVDLIHEAKPAPAPITGDAGVRLDHGKATAEIERLRAALGSEPCDRTRIVQLGEVLIRAGDPRGALNDAAAFFRQCGAYPRLLWTTYGAHEQLSEHSAAILDATKLIEAYPDDLDYWAWRGQAREGAEDFDGAIADYEQSIALEPRVSGIPINLANLYERTGRPCDALFAMERFVIHHPEAITAPQVRERFDRLGKDGACHTLSGQGRAVLHIAAGETAIRCLAEVGGEKGAFIVDTGASFVVLSERFAEKLKLDFKDAPIIRVGTAGGIRTARMVMLETVAVQGASAIRVPAAVGVDLGGRADGLLGLSFLSRFDVHMDAQRGVLEIATRK